MIEVAGRIVEALHAIVWETLDSGLVAPPSVGRSPEGARLQH